MNSIWLSRSKIRRWLLAIVICASLIVWNPLPAFAAVTQIEEYPGQMLYQSRQKLADQAEKSWQVIAFKRVHPEGSAAVSLRLVGFSNEVEFDHTQPLMLTTSMGKILTARDISNDISQDTPTPANVGEYDIQPILPELQAEIPLRLTVATLTGSAIELQIPSSVIQEWQTILDR
ncbi:MAG TPA: DUF3122 domain-containing protein [Coleofasciculaceae cyanobacterium]